jgi:hypothetical protein
MRRALLLLLLLASPVFADTKGDTKPPDKKAPVKKDPDRPRADNSVRPVIEHKEGDYGGVIPGQKPDPSTRPAKPKRPPAKGTLSWIGFEAKDGGAQVFFQSVGPFEVTQHVEGTTLIVHLSLTRLGANTWRQVDTRFFDNPLAGMVARPVRAARATKASPARGSGIEVRVTFKNPKDAREGTVRAATAEADGMYYAYLAFPEGADGKQQPATIKDPEK